MKDTPPTPTPSFVLLAEQRFDRHHDLRGHVVVAAEALSAANAGIRRAVPTYALTPSGGPGDSWVPPVRHPGQRRHHGRTHPATSA
eukprot:7177917-Pyramimonas_sp.AAC.1